MVNYTYAGKYFTNYLGNYYSDYNGTDNDGDGIGDAPYNISNNYYYLINNHITKDTIPPYIENKFNAYGYTKHILSNASNSIVEYPIDNYPLIMPVENYTIGNIVETTNTTNQHIDLLGNLTYRIINKQKI